MHVVTHIFAGWLLADETGLGPRDRALVAWASVVPDADGLGVIVDAANKLLGRGQTTYYELYHHYLGHGLLGAAVTAVLVYACALNKRTTALFALLSFHLHLFMDVIGSRGSNPIDIWPINYLAPFSRTPSIAWSGQWPLTGWQNTTITVLLMMVCIMTALQRGRSPVVLFSRRADLEFVKVLRRRFAQ